MALGEFKSIDEIIPRLGDVLCQDGHVAVLMMTSDRQVRWITIPQDQVSSIQAVMRCMGALVAPLVTPETVPEKKPRKKTKYGAVVGAELRRFAVEQSPLSRKERMKAAMAKYGELKRDRKVDQYLKDNGLDTGQSEPQFHRREGEFRISQDS